MAEIKVSQLPTALDISKATDKSPTKNDLFMIIQDGANKKIAWDTMLSHMNRPVIVNSNMSSIPFTVRGSNLATLFTAVSAINRVGVKTADPVEDLHVEGNIKAGSSTTAGLFIDSSEKIVFTGSPSSGQVGASNNPKAIAVNREVSSIVPVGTCYFTLSTGKVGQTKKILYGNSSGTGNTCIISIPQGNGFNRITMQTKGSTITLVYADLDNSTTGWFVLGYYGSVTFATA